MTYRGIAKGKIIELDEPLPYEEGQPVTVSVEATPAQSSLGSPALVLGAVRKPPHLDPADVDEFERGIEEGKLPVGQSGIFDSDK